MKVLITLHPSYIQRGNWHQLMHLRNDLAKARVEGEFPELRVLPTEYVTHPSARDARLVLMVGDRRPLTVDIETHIGSGEFKGAGVGREAGKAMWLPWCEPFKSLLRSALLDPSSEKVGHNSEAFDWPRLERELGVEVKGPRFDTIIAHAVCYSDLQHRLGRLGQDHYDQEPWKHTMDENLELYCCKDVDVTQRSKVQLEALMEELGVRPVFDRTMSVMPVLVGMTEWGIGVDLEAQEEERYRINENISAATSAAWAEVGEIPQRRQMAAKLITQAEQLEATAEVNWVPGKKREMGKLRTKARRLRKDAGLLGQPNLSSTKQLKTLLYEDMGLPVQYKSEGRKRGPVTTEDAALLELLRQANNPRAKAPLRAAQPFLAALRDHRKGMALKKYVTHDLDALHPEWLPYGTGTGRFSSRNPNAQNFPKRDEDAWMVRRIFVPMRAGNVITEADYSQIERRIQAWDSQDEAMLEAFAKGVDIHRATAAQALGVKLKRQVKPEEVTDRQRRMFKRAVYLESYGGGWQKLQKAMATEGIDLSPDEAREIFDLLKEAHPGYTRRREGILETTKRERMLRNPFGRLRWFLGPSYGDALNFPYQSTAADVIIDAMVRLKDYLWEWLFLQAQVHDSLVVEHHPRETKRVHTLLRDVMEVPVKEMGGWVCPVDIKTGPNWAMKEAA